MESAPGKVVSRGESSLHRQQHCNSGRRPNSSLVKVAKVFAAKRAAILRRMQALSETFRAAPPTATLTATTAKRVGINHFMKSNLPSYFRVPLKAAAKELRVSPTTLKNICRALGLNRWPGRKMRSLERAGLLPDLRYMQQQLVLLVNAW